MDKNGKVWQKPELIVLVWSKPEEAVLVSCKTSADPGMGIWGNAAWSCLENAADP